MKNSLTKIILIFVLCSGFMNVVSYSEIQKKIIREGIYDIEFFVSLKKYENLDSHKLYFWYKSGEIHQSMSSSGGFLLHSDYKKYYKSNQLAEKGKFDYGLKNGVWKKWYKNGNIERIEEWKKGKLDGLFITFDSIGHRLSKGSYKNNYKSGDWIDYIKKDTVSFSKGEIKALDSKKKENFFKRLFKKKNPNQNTKKGSKKKKQNQANKVTQKKPSFFKRLFSKKKKSNKN